MTAGSALYAAALVLLAFFAVLGLRGSRETLARIDAAAARVRGQCTPLALVFTKSGRSQALTVLCIAALAFFALTHRPLWIPSVIVASQVLSQITIEALKPLYARTRPDYYLVGLDAGHSYPSGHSATAVIFFIGWAIVITHTGLPPAFKYALAAIFAAWAIGVWWSRLALGAHYFTDVMGGALFGSAWMCALYATGAHLALFPVH